jgi:hypothetical protein
MFTEIHEPIITLVSYERAGMQLKRFRWRNQLFAVEKVTAVTNIRDGSVRQRRWSVVSGGAVYRLLFDRVAETWELEAVYCE